MIHACGVVWEDYAITIPLEAVECMEKLNTFTFYQLGSLINSVGHIPTKDTQLGDLFFVLNRVRSMLSRHIGDKGILPESSKRAAIVLLRVLHDIGIPAEGQDLTKVDFTASVPGYKLTSVAQRARELETVWNGPHF